MGDFAPPSVFQSPIHKLTYSLNKKITMKTVQHIIFYAVFLMVTPPQAKAVIMPTTITQSDTRYQNNKGTNHSLLFSKIKKHSPTGSSTSQTAKVFAFLFLGLMLLVPIIGFQSRLVIAAAALVVGVVALLLALVGVGAAKDEAQKKEARKSLRIVLGIVVGVILIGLLILNKIGIA